MATLGISILFPFAMNRRFGNHDKLRETHTHTQRRCDGNMGDGPESSPAMGWVWGKTGKECGFSL